MVSVSQNIESRLENPKLQNKSFDNYCESELQESIVKEYNGSVVKTKKLSFYNELTCMFRGRKNPPSGYLSYAAYGRSIAG